jgi:hypothetical protein
MSSDRTKSTFKVGSLITRAVALAVVWVSVQHGTASAANQEQVADPPACVEPKDRHEAMYGAALDPERPFYVDVGPYRYAVPWKYLHPRPPKVMASCKLKGLGVQFWIPDGKAPERDLFWKPDDRPAEKGRPTLGPRGLGDQSHDHQAL